MKPKRMGNGREICTDRTRCSCLAQLSLDFPNHHMDTLFTRQRSHPSNVPGPTFLRVSAPALCYFSNILSLSNHRQRARHETSQQRVFLAFMKNSRPRGPGRLSFISLNYTRCAMQRENTLFTPCSPCSMNELAMNFWPSFESCVQSPL